MTRERSKDPANRDPDAPVRLVPGGKRRDPTPRRFQLNSLRGIRREMGQIYRLARTGELDVAEACRYAYLLTTLGKLSESELLEDRLSRLEQTLEEKRYD